VNFESISVIVQGPIFRSVAAEELGSTFRCLASVRRLLPGAEVILSTWKGANVSGLAPDRVVESEDPGENFRMELGVLRPAANIRRQIVSTRAGLCEATRPYAIKLRADAELRGTAFIDLQQRFSARADELRLFQEHLVAPTFISWNPDRLEPRLFHVSDVFFFGRTEDLRNLFSSPLPPVRCVPEEFAPDDPERAAAEFLTRHTQEQYLHVSFLRHHIQNSYSTFVQPTPAMRRLHDLYIANNYMLASLSRLGVYVHKFHHHGPIATAAHYTEGEWQRLYARFCDHGFRPAPDPQAWSKRFFIHLSKLRTSLRKGTGRSFGAVC
jgi:hypothetical protein